MDPAKFHEESGPVGDEALMTNEVQIACLLGKKPIYSYPWVPASLSSFKKIVNIAQMFYISDGSLDPRDIDETLAGSVVFDSTQEQIVSDVLAKYPNLSRVREIDFSWRKIVDTSIMCKSRYVLLCDSDLFVRAPVRVPIPRKGGTIIYLREDVPAYLAKAYSVIREPVVKSFNSGFVLYSPDDVDFDFLEYVCRMYIPNFSYLWFSEQFAWALLAARQPSPCFWRGDSARVVSSLGGRTRHEISNDVVKWWMRKIPVKSDVDTLYYADNAPVVHLAGTGRPFFKILLDPLDGSTENLELAYSPDSCLGPLERVILFGRLLARNTKHLIRETRSIKSSACVG
jgi:hypothetical protein